MENIVFIKGSKKKDYYAIQYRKNIKIYGIFKNRGAVLPLHFQRIDSTFLLAAAKETRWLQINVIAVTASSCSFPKRLEEAKKQFAEQGNQTYRVQVRRT